MMRSLLKCILVSPLWFFIKHSLGLACWLLLPKATNATPDKKKSASNYPVCRNIPGLAWAGIFYLRLCEVRWNQGINDDADQLARVKSGLFRQGAVRNGIFQGLQYPAFKAAGSAISPKLLGTYELELHASLANILKRRHDCIVDIGSAEGYYAIGLARLTNSTVYAFDSDEKARKLCSEMAVANGVELQLENFCTAESLLKLPLGKRSLIISDCEGYEVELFSEKTVNMLTSHDLIIETHDIYQAGILDALLKRFKNTHNVEVIESFDDKEKVFRYVLPDLNDISAENRLRLLREFRPGKMKWLVATAR